MVGCMMKDLTQRWRRSATSVRARKVVANELDFMMHQYQFTSCCSSVVVYDESLVHIRFPLMGWLVLLVLASAIIVHRCGVLIVSGREAGGSSERSWIGDLST